MVIAVIKEIYYKTWKGLFFIIFRVCTIRSNFNPILNYRLNLIFTLILMFIVNPSHTLYSIPHLVPLCVLIFNIILFSKTRIFHFNLIGKTFFLFILVWLLILLKSIVISMIITLTIMIPFLRNIIPIFIKISTLLAIIMYIVMSEISVYLNIVLVNFNYFNHYYHESNRYYHRYYNCAWYNYK